MYTNEIWRRWWQLSDPQKGCQWYSSGRTNSDWHWAGFNSIGQDGIVIFLNMKTGIEVKLNLAWGQICSINKILDWTTLPFLSPLFVNL